jgi:hypothetical protein
MANERLRRPSWGSAPRRLARTARRRGSGWRPRHRGGRTRPARRACGPDGSLTGRDDRALVRDSFQNGLHEPPAQTAAEASGVDGETVDVEDPVCHLIPERSHRFAVPLGDGEEGQVERGERGDALVQGRDRVVADQLSLDAVGGPLEPDERFRDAALAVVEEDHRESVPLSHRDPLRQCCVRSGCQLDPSGRASRDGRATAPSPVLRTTVARPAPPEASPPEATWRIRALRAGSLSPAQRVDLVGHRALAASRPEVKTLQPEMVLEASPRGFHDPCPVSVAVASVGR